MKMFKTKQKNKKLFAEIPPTILLIQIIWRSKCCKLKKQ